MYELCGEDINAAFSLWLLGLSDPEHRRRHLFTHRSTELLSQSAWEAGPDQTRERVCLQLFYEDLKRETKQV